MTEPPFRIALACVESRMGEKEKNLREVERRACEAARQGARVLCFPELNLTGYCLEADRMRKMAEPADGPLALAVAGLARETGLVLLCGMAEDGGGEKPYASHMAACPDGTVFWYRKLHLNPVEDPVFQPGEEIRVFSMEGLNFGLGLCFDAHFPEMASQMAAHGAQALFFPHASPRGDPTQKEASWLRHLTARAWDNGVFLAAVNPSGINGCGSSFPGLALVLAPSGEVLARRSGGPGLLVADLPLSLLGEVKGHPMRDFVSRRRPDLYHRPVRRLRSGKRKEA